MKKRKLTKREIKDIVSEIEYSGNIICSSITQRIRRECELKLSSIEVYPSVIQELKREIIKHYNETLINPGESVGILAAQSIGEQNTQNTLNTFHHAGSAIATVITGIPRFSELMSATKNPRGTLTTIHFNQEFKSISEMRRDVYPALIHTTVGSIIEKTNTRKKTRKWYTPVLHEKIPPQFKCVSITTDTSMIYDRRILLKNVATRISKELDCVCIASPQPLGIVDVWSECVDEKFLKKLKSITISGVSGFDSISYIQKGDEWLVMMGGFNLVELFKLPFVDSSRTFSNHIWEVYKILGIEATREFLIHEFADVVSSDGYINMSHIYLLVDAMTYSGNVLSISRFGIHRNQSGPLTKASFEKTVDNFLKSALYGEVDSIKGVSSSIVCGKPSIAGTGACALLYE